MRSLRICSVFDKVNLRLVFVVRLERAQFACQFVGVRLLIEHVDGGLVLAALLCQRIERAEHGFVLRRLDEHNLQILLCYIGDFLLYQLGLVVGVVGCFEGIKMLVIVRMILIMICGLMIIRFVARSGNILLIMVAQLGRAKR